MPVCLRTILSDHGQSKFRKQLSSETALVKIIDQLTNLNKDHISALTKERPLTWKNIKSFLWSLGLIVWLKPRHHGSNPI